MSGPQGSDPNQPWQQPGQGQGQDQPSPGSEQQSTETPSWQPPSSDQGSTAQPSWQPPAYTPQQYPQYQQPGPPSYPPTQSYTQPTQTGDYNQPTYQQPTQYGQYGQQQPQYGQPGQYGQQPGQYTQPGQYGQPPQYGQPGQYAAYTEPGVDKESKRSLGLIGAILGVLAAIIVAAVLVLGFWKPGWFMTTKLDVNKAQAGVQQVLTDETNGYGAKNVKDVKCNNGQSPTVKKGDTFNCEVSIDGTKRQVTVTFQDDSGTYEVGRPK
jgi:Domain of unknown function (DUF4333)